MNPDQIESLPDSQPHRHVDLAIVKADKEGERSDLPVAFFGAQLTYQNRLFEIVHSPPRDGLREAFEPTCRGWVPEDRFCPNPGVDQSLSR